MVVEVSRGRETRDRDKFCEIKLLTPKPAAKVAVDDGYPPESSNELLAFTIMDENCEITCQHARCEVLERGHGHSVT